MRTGAETGVTRPPVSDASDRRRPPEARDRKREGSAVGCRRGTALSAPGFRTPGLYNCEILNFCSFNPPGRWRFVVAALGNEYSACPETLNAGKKKKKKKPVETRHFKSSVFAKDLEMLSGVLYRW